MFLSLVGTAFMTQSSSAVAQETLFRAATELSAQEAQWRNRVLILFAPNPKDPALLAQLDILETARADLRERDMIVLRDTAVNKPSTWRRRVKPNGFEAVLIGKDGGIKLRSDRPVSMQDLSGLIDEMPMRQQEMQQDN